MHNCLVCNTLQASNSYLQLFSGANVKMVLEFAKEMPKSASPMKALDVSASFGPSFFTWIIEMLLPVRPLNFLTSNHSKDISVLRNYCTSKCSCR